MSGVFTAAYMSQRQSYGLDRLHVLITLSDLYPTALFQRGSLSPTAKRLKKVQQGSPKQSLN